MSKQSRGAIFRRRMKKASIPYTEERIWVSQMRKSVNINLEQQTTYPFPEFQYYRVTPVQALQNLRVVFIHVHNVLEVISCVFTVRVVRHRGLWGWVGARSSGGMVI